MNQTSNIAQPARSRAGDNDPGFLMGPAERYAALALVSNFVVVFWFALEGWGTLAVGLGLALGLLCIFARMRLAIPLFLAWVLIVLFAQYDDASRSRLAYGPRDTSGSAAWIVTGAVMVFLIAVTRLHALKVGIFPGRRDPRYFWTRLSRYFKGSGTKTNQALRDPASCSALEHATVPLWAIFWMLVAGLVLELLPAAAPYARFYGLNERAMRMVAAAWLIVMLPALASAALAYARWRRLSRPEAAVYLRSVLWRWNRKEQRAIARYAARRLRRRRRTGNTWSQGSSKTDATSF